jgi:hypothetical protein
MHMDIRTRRSRVAGQMMTCGSGADHRVALSLPLFTGTLCMGECVDVYVLSSSTIVWKGLPFRVFIFAISLSFCSGVRGFFLPFIV